MANVVVTGGAGFIGSHLCEKLVEKGFHVRVVDNLSSGKKNNLSKIIKAIEFARADIKNFSLLKKHFRNADCVFHLAALRSVMESVRKPAEFARVNIEGTINVLEAAKQSNAGRVVFASSSSVYGNCSVFPQKESFIPMPLSPYAVSKLACEHLLRQYFEVFGTETISLRYFNVFGPRQDKNSEYAAVIPKFISLVLEGKKPEIFGSGKQSRDFTFVEDIANANIAAMKAKKRAVGKAINIASGKSVSVNRVLEDVNRITGKNIKPVHLPARKEEVFKTLADTVLAKKLLGFKCKWEFDDALKRTIGHYGGVMP